jgi:hypothetical protein
MDDKVKEAKDAFEQVSEAEQDNRSAALDDLRFSRLGEQWPADIIRKRKAKGKPYLTINKMPAFIRQVVNDARQNKPSIKVHPVDSGSDKETAKILSELIRNIEYSSNADVAYDTAAESAVGIGFGYFRIGLDHAYEDSFDLDIQINRVNNPFSVYGDPASTAADSSDWNSAFVVELMTKQDFEEQYKGADPVDWQSDDYKTDGRWFTEDSVMVAERWIREKYEKQLYKLSDGTIQTAKQMEMLQGYLAATGITVAGERLAKCYRVKQIILSGAEVLKEEEWAGRYIPIVPVYGDEVDVEGKRHFRSLIRDAKDAQRMFNYWRTMTTESVALAPKTPFIGPVGAFKTDTAKWATANNEDHAFIEYDKAANGAPPQRQPFVGVPAGALQEALNASDDMKAIMGMYDASLGARSNETSGRAIMARQREGDISTFHFQDNLARAIRHAGRILLDLIPHVYDKPRIIRVMGEDGTPHTIPLKQPTPVTDQNGQPVMGDDGVPMTRIYDLAAGKYDLTVSTGPSFTTRREEAAVQMTEMIRAFPAAAPVIGDLLAKNLDWPGADEIAERLKSINPALQQQGGIPPEVQQQIQEGMQRLQELEAENQNLKAANAVKMAELDVKREELAVKREELNVDLYRAHTERMKPEPQPAAA